MFTLMRLEVEVRKYGRVMKIKTAFNIITAMISALIVVYLFDDPSVYWDVVLFSMLISLSADINDN